MTRKKKDADQLVRFLNGEEIGIHRDPRRCDFDCGHHAWFYPIPRYMEYLFCTRCNKGVHVIQIEEKKRDR